MYFACIRFDFLDEILDFPEKQKLIFQSGHQTCYLSSLNEAINKSQKYLIKFGGFKNYDEARLIGESLYYSLKLQFIKDGIRVRMSADSDILDSTNLSTSYSKYITKGNYQLDISTFQQFGANDYLGLQILEADCSDNIKIIEYPDVRIGDITIDRLAFKFLSINLDKITNQFTSSISLLNASVLLGEDIRLSFLLKIMAIEALTPSKQSEDEETISKIDKILLDIHDDEMRSRIGAFKNKSIGKKCLDLICCYSSDEYNGQSAVSFWKECYNLRSSLVHDGIADIEMIRLKIVELNRLVCEIVENYIVV